MAFEDDAESFRHAARMKKLDELQKSAREIGRAEGKALAFIAVIMKLEEMTTEELGAWLTTEVEAIIDSGAAKGSGIILKARDPKTGAPIGPQLVDVSDEPAPRRL